MFNWVCPRCGRENSPSYIDCPDCKERDALEQAKAEAEAPVPVYQAPPVPYQPPMQTQEWQPQYQQPPQPPQPPPTYTQQQPIYQPQQPPQYAPQPPLQPPPQPQYAPPQQYAQPPQYAPQQPPQYAPQPPQQFQPQQFQPQQPNPQTQQQPPQYAPQPPQYAQTQPVYVQQPQYAPPPQPQYAPPTPAPQPAPVVAPRPTKAPYVPPATPAPPEPPEPGFAAKLGALPTPLLMLLFAVVFLLVGAAIYYGYQRFGKGSAGFSGGEPAATATKQPKATNPIQKYIEVVGIRLTTDAKKKPVAKFLIVNHASTAMSNLGANVTLWASTSRSEEDSVGSFTFHVDDIGPYESKEVSAPFKTKLKIYELPDWQNATAEVQITSPQP